MSEDIASASLPDALTLIDKLEELLEDEDNREEGQKCASAISNQPNVEAQASPLVYQVNFDTNFEDRNGFVTGIAKYMEEATVHSALKELLIEGEQFAVTLYTWRCCSRGIPQPKSDDDPLRVEIYEMIVEVLTPEVEKLFKLMKFQKRAIDKFCQEVKMLCHAEKKKEFVSEAYLLTLGKIINMFAILDELKNIKSSVKNDFSTFKRSTQFLKLDADVQALQESQNLSMFLGTHNKIRINLKKQLEQIPNYVDLLSDVINICVSMFESTWKLYLTQGEKHMLVKVIGFSLDLIDNDRCTIYKLDHKKKISIEKIDKIFWVIEVVPLFGDMQISPFDYVRKSKHFEPGKWPLCVAASAATANSSGPGSHIDIVRSLPQIANDHLKYVCQLQEATVTANILDPVRKTSETEEGNEKLYNLALKGLQLLSEWTTAVSELYSWKLLHPTDHHQNPKCPPEAEEYERATRYNYTNEEKSALVQVIGMIKGLQSTLSKMEPVFADAIRRDVYSKLQTFIQITLREPIRKAIKHKKTVLRSILLSIRDTCADWMGSSKWAEDDPVLKGEKGPPNFNFDSKIGKRSVGPSSTQLYLLRTMLESLLSEKTCANRILRKDLDDKHIPLIEQFYKKTFHWNYLFNFGEMLQKSADLSQLWYREFYLEMSMGKRIQFPIEMSPVWIFLDHVLNNPSLMEYALYPLDLYNDATHYALNIFRKRHLYDELEAEVNLCFDQFVFKLSEQIFIYYKKQAATILLDKRFQANCPSGEQKSTISNPSLPCRYESLMKQRRVYLLGHYIDLNRLIRQRISKSLLESLKTAIGKFMEGDLTGIIQLEALIDVNRETHKALKKHLSGLDEFDWLLKEANNNVSTTHGKTTFHIFCELNYDFLPNYCYNGSTDRFVKSAGIKFSEKAVEHREDQYSNVSVPPQYLWGSKQLNAAYSKIFSLYSGFIGTPHFRAMVKLLGYQGIAVVIKEILKVVEGLITSQIQQHISDLMEIIPKKSSVPIKILNHEGSPGVFQYYFGILSGFLQHPGVRTETFQHFREVGNALLFCLRIEQNLAQEENWHLFHSAPFVNIHPLRFPSKTESGSEVVEKKLENMIKLEREAAALHVSGNVEEFGTEKQRILAKEGELLSRERLCCGLSIFQEVLKQITRCLKDPIWAGSPPKDGVMNIDEGNEFHRLWSCMQFVYCLPVGPNELSVEQLYGDSLHWAGCLFIALLGQQHRFEIFDFCYRLLEIQRADRKDGVMSSGVGLERTVRRIKRFQVLNSQIFSLLNIHIQQNKEALRSSRTIELEHVRCFHPPIHKLATGTRTSLQLLVNDENWPQEQPTISSPVYEELSFGSSGEGSLLNQEHDHAGSVSVLYQNTEKPEKQESDSNVQSAMVSSPLIV